MQEVLRLRTGLQSASTSIESRRVIFRWLATSYLLHDAVCASLSLAWCTHEDHRLAFLISSKYIDSLLLKIHIAASLSPLSTKGFEVYVLLSNSSKSIPYSSYCVLAKVCTSRQKGRVALISTTWWSLHRMHLIISRIGMGCSEEPCSHQMVDLLAVASKLLLVFVWRSWSKCVFWCS